jgi:uncharacterized membrane protein YfcA
MGPGEAAAILGAGIAAGAVNAVVGSGSLITFPTLLAFGFPPVVANVSNNVGLVSGNVSGAVGYRRELAGQRSRLLRLSVFAVAGSLAGSAALLSLPSSSFKLIVPALILIACVLVFVQPWLSGRIAARRDRRAAAEDAEGPAGPERTSPVLAAGVVASAAYGGYFGAAQGVLVIGLLGTFLDDRERHGGHRVHHLRARGVAGRAAHRGRLHARRHHRRALRQAAAAAGAADLRGRDRRGIGREADLLLAPGFCWLPAVPSSRLRPAPARPFRSG